MEHEPPAGLNRTTVMNGTIGRLAGFNIQLSKQAPEGDSCTLVADANPNGAIFIMDAHCDHGPLKARIGHSRHCQQQLAGEEIRLLHHC
jgi:hypothetical protein